MGVARVEGDGSSYQGSNINGGVSAAFGTTYWPDGGTEGKSYGIVSIDGVLYMWVTGGKLQNIFDHVRMYRSTDRGRTWEAADWNFTDSDGLVVPTILQFGKDYAGARDNFVYHYFIELQDRSSELNAQRPGKIHLLRVDKKEMLTSKSSYEYFDGLDSDGDPVWSNDIDVKQPVFEDPNGVGWNLGVTYNAGLDRYILTTEHTESRKGNLGVFDAPEPWGPWTTVAYMNWSDGTHFAHDFSPVPETVFLWNFSNKWLSEDGKNFTMIFTGTGDNDSWNTVRGSFEVAFTDPTVPQLDATPPTDVVPPGEATPPVDVVPPANTTPSVDAVPPADATPPADAASPSDTRPSVDVVPPGDSTPPADAAPERETLLPTAPVDLVSRWVSPTQISLVWSPVSDPDGGVTSYKVYRDGVLVATLSGATFTDTGLMEGASYTYQVSAVNSNWVEGPKSAPTIRSTAADTNGIYIPVIIVGVIFLVGLAASGLVFLARRAR
jgi:hypothetical protein